MKIGQIAPPWITIPPRNYGGTENVVYTLVEEQVAQGHEVTLFAPGDAQTSAKHVSFFPKSLLAAGESWQAHLKAFYHFHCAVEYLKEHDFDVVHTHLSSASDLYLFPLLTQLATPHVTTLHSPFPFDAASGSKLGATDAYYMRWLSTVPMVAISESARAEAPKELHFVGVVHNGLPMNDFRPTGRKRADFFGWLGRFARAKGPIVLAGTIDCYRQESVR